MLHLVGYNDLYMGPTGPVFYKKPIFNLKPPYTVHNLKFYNDSFKTISRTPANVYLCKLEFSNSENIEYFMKFAGIICQNYSHNIWPKLLFSVIIL